MSSKKPEAMNLNAPPETLLTLGAPVNGSNPPTNNTDGTNSEQQSVANMSSKQAAKEMVKKLVSERQFYHISDIMMKAGNNLVGHYDQFQIKERNHQKHSSYEYRAGSIKVAGELTASPAVQKREEFKALYAKYEQIKDDCEGSMTELIISNCVMEREEHMKSAVRELAFLLFSGLKSFLVSERLYHDNKSVHQYLIDAVATLDEAFLSELFEGRVCLKFFLEQYVEAFKKHATKHIFVEDRELKSLPKALTNPSFIEDVMKGKAKPVTVSPRPPQQAAPQFPNITSRSGQNVATTPVANNNNNNATPATPAANIIPPSLNGGGGTTINGNNSHNATNQILVEMVSGFGNNSGTNQQPQSPFTLNLNAAIKDQNGNTIDVSEYSDHLLVLFKDLLSRIDVTEVDSSGGDNDNGDDLDENDNDNEDDLDENGNNFEYYVHPTYAGPNERIRLKKNQIAPRNNAEELDAAAAEMLLATQDEDAAVQATAAAEARMNQSGNGGNRGSNAETRALTTGALTTVGASTNGTAAEETTAPASLTAANEGNPEGNGETVVEAPNLTPMELESNRKCKDFLVWMVLKIKPIFETYHSVVDEKETNKLYAAAFKDEEKKASKSNMAKDIIDAEGKVDKQTMNALIDSKVDSKTKELKKKVNDLEKQLSKKRKADSKKDHSGSTAAAAKAAAAKKKKTSHPPPTLNNQSGKGGKNGGGGKQKQKGKQPQKQPQKPPKQHGKGKGNKMRKK